MIDIGAAGWVSPDYEHHPPTVCIFCNGLTLIAVPKYMRKQRPDIPRTCKFCASCGTIYEKADKKS